jgi:hypothetical protein
MTLGRATLLLAQDGLPLVPIYLDLIVVVREGTLNSDLRRVVSVEEGGIDLNACDLARRGA